MTAMLIKAKTLKSYKLNALDGEMGRALEFYFDDHHWTIRYLVADTGTWLSGRKVLISPHALIAVSKEEQHISVDLTRKQIEDSTFIDTDKPVSRQYEKTYYEYYGWPAYWAGSNMWGMCPYIMRDRRKWRETTQEEPVWDRHLRSTNGVSGHYIHASDGEIGHIEDFIIDDDTWAIRYLIIDTRNWWPGKKVLISPQWIESVSWSESKVYLSMSRNTVKMSPEYTNDLILNRDYEIRLHQNYQYQGYWVNEMNVQKEAGTANTCE